MKKKVILFLCLMGVAFSLLSCGKKKPKKDLKPSELEMTLLKETADKSFAEKTYYATTDGNMFSISFSENWSEDLDDGDPYVYWGEFTIEENLPQKNIRSITMGECRYNIETLSFEFETTEREIYNLQTGEFQAKLIEGEKDAERASLFTEYDGEWLCALGGSKSLDLLNTEKNRNIKVSLGTPEEVEAAAEVAAAKAEESEDSALASKPAETNVAYVNKLIDWCNQGISDPWNEEILKNIEELSKKLANGSYGNSTYGVDSEDPNEILDKWIELETAHIAFLSAAPHFKLTYTAKATPLKANDIDTGARMIRFKPKFNFSEDFVGKKNLESAYKRLQKSNFVMAAAVREYGKNKPLYSPDSIKNVKTNPNGGPGHVYTAKYNVDIPTLMRGTPDHEYDDKDTAITVSSVLGVAKSLGKGMAAMSISCYHVPLREVAWEYKNITKGWYKWKPAVQVAVADAEGNVLSKWTWWRTKDDFELCVPMADYHKADHYVFSKGWTWYDDSNVTSHGYIDDEFEVPDSQIVKR